MRTTATSSGAFAPKAIGRELDGWLDGPAMAMVSAGDLHRPQAGGASIPSIDAARASATSMPSTPTDMIPPA